MINKDIIGIVISNRADKTILVAKQEEYENTKYLKKIKRLKYYVVHDKYNMAYIEDIVVIEKCNPISRNKKWILKKIINY